MNELNFLYYFLYFVSWIILREVISLEVNSELLESMFIIREFDF